MNECSVNNGGCSDGCTNTPGSYICTCQTNLGYFLGPDGHGCIGQYGEREGGGGMCVQVFQ